ncbi:LppX_LprAFG lipoprotein [Actinomycetospora chiangmaiensis]|uniref:LppX_LprAFG lipoprotein n=1 Tax=Actinomycetospora chiangmaiensis TaxID=402650 RepID=UPI0012FCD89A|nr:LppX_LprAFG lipoprotein [Actinomycetospora chiangmaiensis]
MALMRVFVVVLVLLGVLSGCASLGLGRDDTAAGQAARPGARGDAGEAESIRTAARATAAADGATVQVRSSGPARDRSITTTGSGVVDFRGRTSSTALRISDLGRVDALAVGRTAFGALPPRAINDISRGRQWVSVELDGVDTGLFADTVIQLGSGITGNPADLTTTLLAIRDDVVMVGPETIDEVPTVHLRGDVDLAALRALAPELGPVVDRLRTGVGLTTLPVDVWLDTEGKVRQVSETVVPGQATTTVTFTDLLPQATVVAPPAEMVRDLFKELRARAG